MRPSSGTGHSTRPATSSSKPGSSTTVSWRSAARRAMPSAMTWRRSAASASTRRLAQAGCQSACACAPRTRRGRGSDGPRSGWTTARPWPSSAPSRRSNGTTAPSSRQTMRRSGRTQVKSLPAPQRIDLGQGKRRSTGGMAAGDQRRRRAARRRTFPAPSSRLPGEAGPCVALCLRRKPVSAWSGALVRGPRSLLLAAATPAATSAGKRDAARAVEGADRGRRQRRQRLGGQPGEVIRGAGLHARRNFLAEKFEKEFRHAASLVVVLILPARGRCRRCGRWRGRRAGRWRSRG